MGHVTQNTPFNALNIALLTVSDTRELSSDESGNLLQQRIESAGHQLAERQIVKDDIYQIRAVVSHWIASEQVHAIVITGGTGFGDRDNTPEALSPLFDKQVEGYGELFRQLSFNSIGTSSMQSRALAGIANKKVVFAMPGSPRACALAWDELIQPQLDARQRPCNFVAMVVSQASSCQSRANQ
ncbi:molybdenum cofactor biosynthesis protein B [Nitrincola alkalilacustris]|uniref:molybdenum cofactor biosynthesis protein B n=1 Tax=Nitrincola alkalilacustris TaxID=1571224 RepID=UPI00124DB280|nr:molybdenum cofactor biosynthesis protein B [Nitrincola alkalilacustris]